MMLPPCLLLPFFVNICFVPIHIPVQLAVAPSNSLQLNTNKICNLCVIIIIGILIINKLTPELPAIFSSRVIFKIFPFVVWLPLMLLLSTDFHSIIS